MYSKGEISNIIKLKIKLNKYDEAIRILKKEIIEIYSVKIKEVNKQFRYTNIFDLIEEAEKRLNEFYNIQLKKYFCIINDECSNQYELYNLMNIYSKVRGEDNGV